MKTSACIIAGMTVLAVALFTTRGALDDTETIDLAGKYAVMIEDTIAKCLKKAKHLDSRSPNIQRASFISYLKAGYLKTHKEDLAIYLTDVKAIPSASIVQYHLNKKFYETFRPHEIYALLRANQIPSNLRAANYSVAVHDNE